jgi:hypothetical protein
MLNSKGEALGSFLITVTSKSETFSNSKSLNDYETIKAIISAQGLVASTVEFTPNINGIRINGIKTEPDGDPRFMSINFNANKTGFTGVMSGGNWDIKFLGLKY